MFITSKNKYLSNDMNIFGTCSIPLSRSEKTHLYWQCFLETKEGDKLDKYCRQPNQVRNITHKIVRSTEKVLLRRTQRIWSYIHSTTKSRSGISQLHTNKINEDGKPVLTKNDVKSYCRSFPVSLLKNRQVISQRYLKEIHSVQFNSLKTW